MVPSDSQVVTSSSQTSDRPEPLVVAMPYSWGANASWM